MGSFGFATRVLSGKLNSFITFTSPSHESGALQAAPGQIDPETLCKLYNFRNINEDTKIFAVTGFPLAATKSPLIHNKGYQLAGINCVYLPVPAARPEEILDFSSALGILGLSVTVPHKETIMPFLDDISPSAIKIGSCNTIFRKNGKLYGTNTDADGFSKALLDLLLQFKREGMTCIIISHKLNEVAYVADDITVIRDGKTIETLHQGVDDISEDRIIRGMVGREIADRFPKRPDVVIGDVCMEVKNWTVHHPIYREKKVVDDVSFYVRKGEVVGISGLMGAGRTELAMSLFGHSYGSGISGTLTLGGKEVVLKNEKDAIRHGLAYVTEDRKGNGLILSNPIRVNTTLANLEGVSHNTVVDTDKEYAVSDDYRQKLHTKCTGVEQTIGNLSGGNQQKVLLAKWMFTNPDVLILDEPTRGIDVGAKYEIYCIINQLVAEGKSVIMISSELPEILGMSDRIYVMNNGQIVGEFGKEEASQESIMACILKSAAK